MTSKGRVKVGIIGSQFEGDIHAASIAMVPDAAEVVAVASPAPGNAQKLADKYGIERVFTDYWCAADVCRGAVFYAEVC